MSFQINHVPYEMNAISSKLFNVKFLSDITFAIEGKEIFAHSMELMKRSDVFQRNLQATLGEHKLIPITAYGYEDFYQFIQFMYTDECDVNSDNWLNLINIAKEYNVIRLVNVIQNSRFSEPAALLEFCVAENHQCAVNCAKLNLAIILRDNLEENLIGSMHPDLLEEILKYDQFMESVTEMKIVKALVDWMGHYCNQNKITFVECRQKFQKLIRLIRFPAMSNEELLIIKNKYPELLTKSDLTIISGQKVFGVEYEDGVFNCAPRKQIDFPFYGQFFANYDYCETTFSVESDMILGGFTFGSPFPYNHFNIKISCQSSITNELPETSINVNETVNSYFCSFRSSIRLTSNILYTIGYKTITEHNSSGAESEYYCRLPELEITVNAPPNSVQIIIPHQTMLELFFLNADGQPF